MLLFSTTIITLVIENNFYTKDNNHTNKSLISGTEIVEISNPEKNKEKVESPEKVEPENKSPDIEKISTTNEELEKKSSQISEKELIKIINERTEQVKNNSKSIEENVSEEVPEIVSLVLAKIISDYKLDNQNFSLESYEEKTWGSTALGCPKNGMTYAQVITEGYILNVTNYGETEQYNADSNGNYINCSEINQSNLNSDFNFVKKYNLEKTEKITLFTNKNNKLVSSIENKEELLSIIDSLNIEIEVKTSDKCEANYKLVFEKISSDIEMLVYCQNNPYYVEVEQSLNAGKSILSVVEKILTNMEFPGMPQ